MAVFSSPNFHALIWMLHISVSKHLCSVGMFAILGFVGFIHSFMRNILFSYGNLLFPRQQFLRFGKLNWKINPASIKTEMFYTWNKTLSNRRNHWPCNVMLEIIFKLTFYKYEAMENFSYNKHVLFLIIKYKWTFKFKFRTDYITLNPRNSGKFFCVPT